MDDASEQATAGEWRTRHGLGVMVYALVACGLLAMVKRQSRGHIRHIIEEMIALLGEGSPDWKVGMARLERVHVVTSVAGCTLLIIAALAATWRSRRQVASALGIDLPPARPIELVAIATASSWIGLLIAGYAWMRQEPLWGGRWATAGDYVLLVLAAPFCEEIFFRGWLQRSLGRAVRPALAIALAASSFAVMHDEPVSALIAGLWFGVVAWSTGSTLVAIASHAVVNATLLCTAGFLGTAPPGADFLVRMAVVVVPLTIAGILALLRVRARTNLAAIALG